MDTTSPPAPVTLHRTWITIITMLALAFNAAIILYVVIAGDPNNNFQGSALAWAYGTGMIILTGLGIGSSLTTILEFFRPIKGG